MLLVLQQLFLSAEQLAAWGWRIPFVIGAGTALVALYLRRRLIETESFLLAQRRGTPHDWRGTWGLLRHHARAVAIVVGLTIGGIVSFYTFTTYAQKFLVNTAGLTREAATAVSAGTLFIFVLLQPAFGALSDRIGRRPLLIGFGALGGLLTVPLMTALSRAHDPWVAASLIMVALVILSGYTAINGVVKAEMFPTSVRAIGVGLPYAVTVSLFGGTTEYVALALKGAGHEPWFYAYVSCCIFVSLIASLFMTDTRSRDLDA